MFSKTGFLMVTEYLSPRQMSTFLYTIVILERIISFFCIFYLGQLSFFSFFSICMSVFLQNKKSRKQFLDFQLGYKDSNLEMTESESVALPFGDSPLFDCDID